MRSSLRLNRNVNGFRRFSLSYSASGEDASEMVKLSRILLLVVAAKLVGCATSTKSVVIVNNKQMTYNRKGELVEIESDERVKSPKLMMQGKPVKLLEKSNIFKQSAFVTNSNFKDAKKGILMVKDKTRDQWGHPPLRSPPHTPTRAQRPTKKPQSSHIYPEITSFSTPNPYDHSSVIITDDLTSVEDSLNQIYNEAFKNDFQKLQMVTDRPPPQPEEEPGQQEESDEAPAYYVYSTPPPTPTIIPMYLSSQKPKKKKKSTTTTTTTQPPMLDHLIQNLDLYRKILAPNCTFPKSEFDIATESTIVQITPKPNQTVEKAEKPGDHKQIEGKKKKKKKCKKKHGHGHSHEDDDSSYEESHEVTKHKPDVHEHFHHFDKEHAGHGHGHGHKHKHKHKHDSEVFYIDPLDEKLDKATDIFSTFYNFIEDAMVSKEFLQYGRDGGSDSYVDSDSSHDDYGDGGGWEGYFDRRRKRSVDQASAPRKSLTTKISVTSEYDDSPAGFSSSLRPISLKLPPTTPKKPTKPKKKKPKDDYSDEDSEEYSLFGDIMNFRDDFDDTGDVDEDMSDSEYYYEEIPQNRLPSGDPMGGKDYSEEAEDSPISGMFNSIGDLFSSWTGYGDSAARNPPKRNYYDYGDEGRSTTEKVEHQPKRPKRENVPWYHPSFLFTDDDDDEAAAISSTTRRNWPWQQLDDDEEAAATTTMKTESTPTTSTEKDSIGFLDRVSQFWSAAPAESESQKPKARPKRKTYDGHQLWRVEARTKSERKAIDEFKLSPEGSKLRWLKGPSTKGISDVVVAPELVESFKEFLAESDAAHFVRVRDIQHAIEFENPRLNKREQIEHEVIHGHPLTWFRYHPYRDIQSYFEFLKRKHSDVVDLIQIGWSFEGRPLTIVKISHRGSESLAKEHRSVVKRPAVLIQSGTEAHEWLQISSTTRIIETLVSRIDSNDTVGDLIRQVDWFVMPVLNVDGYDWSIHYDRLWQKTRSKHFPATGIWTSA